MKTGIHGSGTLDSRQNTKIYSLRGTITEQYYCTQRGRGVRWGEPQEKKKKKNREIDKLAPIYSLSLYDNKKDRTKIGRSKEVVCNCVKNNLKRKETFLDIHYSFASWLSQVSEWVSVCVCVCVEICSRVKFKLKRERRKEFEEVQFYSAIDSFLLPFPSSFDLFLQ